MKFRSCHHRTCKGITLIEALVTIAIAVALFALGSMAIGGMRRSAGTVGCMQNLQSIYMGVSAYAHDNNGQLPLYSNNMPGDLPWSSVILPYLGIISISPYPKVFQCPVRQVIGTFNYKNMNYGWNACFPPSINAARVSPSLPNVKMHQLPYPSKLLLIAETDSSVNALSYVCRDEGAGSQYKAYYIHQKRANALFMDGHVRAMTKEEMNLPSESEPAFQLWYPLARKL